MTAACSPSLLDGVDCRVAQTSWWVEWRQYLGLPLRCHSSPRWLWAEKGNIDLPSRGSLTPWRSRRSCGLTQCVNRNCNALIKLSHSPCRAACALKTFASCVVALTCITSILWRALQVHWPPKAAHHQLHCFFFLLLPSPCPNDTHHM